MNFLRKDFPFLISNTATKPALCYFDNAATSQKPASVLQAMNQFYTQYNANIYRGIYQTAEHATQAYENARAKLADFFGVDTKELIFTRGTTEGINAIAATWAETHLTEGDEIVLTELEHHANIVPWQVLARKKGITIRYIPITGQGLLNYTGLDRFITNKTKLVSITHCSNALGTWVDLKPIIDAAKAVNAKIMVDGAQSAPHQRINLKQLQIDFFVCSGHKMLGPTGIGILFINKELHDQIPPYQLGGGMVQEVSWHNAQFRPFPWCFEAGTPAIAEAIGLAAAVEYLTEYVNFEQLKHHEAQLCNRLITGLQQYRQIRILGPVEQLRSQGHIVSFVVDKIHSHDVAAYLDSYNVAVRAGNHCAQPLLKKLGVESSVRVSFYVYNTLQEVDRFLTIIKTLLDSNL